MHWACKRNYLDVVVLLLKSGADKSIKSDKGETPASVSTNPCILQLLGASPEFCKIVDQEASTFVPNYIKNAPISRKIELNFPPEVSNACQEGIILFLTLYTFFNIIS